MKHIPLVNLGSFLKDKELDIQTGPFGTQLKASDYSSHGTPVINVRNIGFRSEKIADLEYLNEAHSYRLRQHRLEKNDIAFGRKGAVDRHLIIKEKQNGWIQGSDCIRIRIKSKLIDPDFLSFFFLTGGHRSWMEIQGSFGATMGSLNQGIIERISFPLFPLPIQRKIAAVLSAYDDLIENNTRRIAILEKMAEELYREWFVRLRFPGHEKTKIVKGVPEGWEIKKLPEIADITYGFAFDGSRFNTAGIGKPIVRIRNIIDSSTSDYSDEEANEKYIVKRGDLLIGMDGNFHINHWFGEEAYLVQRSCRIGAKRKVQNGYLALAIVAPVKFFEATVQGATVAHLGAKHLNSIDVLIPAADQNDCLEIFNNLVRQKINLSSASNNLKQSRDGLLSRLMSGKIDLEHLDIQFPPSMCEEQPAHV